MQKYFIKKTLNVDIKKVEFDLSPFNNPFKISFKISQEGDPRFTRSQKHMERQITSCLHDISNNVSPSYK